MSLRNRAGLIKIIDAIGCMENCLSCAICLEISSDPVETRCGHLFCRKCIKKVLSHPSQSCPICKTNLTQRSFSSSHQMVMCIKQLSKLCDAICDDTSIDIKSCLAMHYKEAVSLPSIPSSSSRSLQDIQNHLPVAGSNSEVEKICRDNIDERAVPRSSQENRPSSNVEKNSNVDSDEPVRTKPSRSTNPPRNVVSFKKRGHLFKARRKGVAFLYCGMINQPGSKFHDGSRTIEISKHYSSRLPTDESRSTRKFDDQTIVPLCGTETPELPITTTEFFENLTNDSNENESTKICGQSHSSSIKYDERENLKLNDSSVDRQSPFAMVESTKKILTDKNRESSTVEGKRKRSESSDRRDSCSKKQNRESDYCQSDRTENFESPWQEDHENTILSSDTIVARPAESSTVEGKRKRSESSDRRDSCSKKQNRESDYCQSDRTLNSESPWQEDHENTILSSDTIVARPTEITPSKIHPMDIDETNEASKHRTSIVDRVEIHLPEKIESQRSKSTSMIEKSLSNLHETSISKVHCPSQSNVSRVSADDKKFDLSQDSMMNITAEEMMWKEFENNLFRPKSSENHRPSDTCDENLGRDKEDSSDGREKNNPESPAFRNSSLSPKSVDLSLTITKIASTQNSESRKFNESREDIDSVGSSPKEQNFNRLKSLSPINQHKHVAMIHANPETLENNERKKFVKSPLPKKNEVRNLDKSNSQSQTRNIKSPLGKKNRVKNLDKSNSQSQTRTKIGSLHPIIRKFTEQNKSDSNCSSTTSTIVSDVNSRLTDSKVSRKFRGCIVGSGLTTSQYEGVEKFSNMFDMTYTKKFSDDVTHVIVKTTGVNNGACKTLKYLQGIVYRKWVLSFDWIVDCLLERKLLNEDDYEVVDSVSLIPGPMKSRTGETGPFRNFVFLCVEPFQNISVTDYEDLLRHMGGTVVRSMNELAAHPSALKIILVQTDVHEREIMAWYRTTRAVAVAQEWIIDCVSRYRLVTLLPFLEVITPQDVLDLSFPEKLVEDE